jgi:hypothetical protein
MAGRSMQIVYTANAAGVLATQNQINAGHAKMQGSVNKTGTAFKSAFGSVIPLGAAAAGVAVVALATTVIKSAADQVEAVNKTKVIFGESAESVLAFSDTAASAFGIAKAEALNAAGGFGAMLDSAGLAEKAAASMSVRMVKLAGDMASFNNEDPSAMLERLRSGLAGEAEPLRRFGVFLSEAAVKAEAYSSGIAAVGSELTEAQKVQARYNIILRQTTKQQGDFGRTLGESLPNQLRVMRAELIDMAADIGQELLPALIELVQALRDILPVLKPIIEGFAEVVSMGASAISALTDIATFDWTGAESGFTGVMERVRELTSEFDQGHITADEFRNGLIEIAEASGTLIKWSRDLTLAAQAERDAIANSVAIAEAYAPALNEAANATRDGTGATQSYTEAAREAANALREQRLAVLALSNSFLGIVDSANQVSEAQRVLNALERKGREDTKAYEQAVLDALAAQIGLEDAVLSFGVELADSGETAKAVKEKIRDLGSQFGIQKGIIADLIQQVMAYIRSLNNIPSSVNTSVHISGGGTTGGITAQHGFHGTVRRPTLILAGEAGAERVDITPGGGHGRGGGDGMTIVFNAPVIGPGGMDEVVDIIREGLVRKGRHNGGRVFS